MSVDIIKKLKNYETKMIFGEVVFWSGIGIFLFTIFYVVSLVELSLFESILQPDVLILNFFLALVTAVMFATYEKGLRQFVEKNFLRYAYDPHEVIRTLTTDLSQTAEISKAIYTFFDTLTAATTVKTCGFIIHQASSQEWLKEEWVGIQTEQKNQLVQEEALNDLLFYGAGEGVTFIQTRNLQTPSLKVNLAKEHIYLAAHIQQDEYNAVLLIGNKRKKGPLTEDDTYVIEHGLFALLHRIKEIQWQ